MRRSIALLLLAACADVPVAPPEIEARLAASHVWSGSEVRVVAGGLAAADSVAILLDGDPLATARRDDSTVSAPLPDAPGTHAVRLLVDGQRLPVGEVTLAGFHGARNGPALKGPLWPLGPGSARALGQGATGAVVYDVSADATQSLAADSVARPDCGAGGIGSSYRAGVFAAPSGQGACGRLRARTFLPTVSAPLDSGPVVTDGAYGHAEVAPGRWVWTSDSWAYFSDCRSGTCVPIDMMTGTLGVPPSGGGGARRVVPSPRRDRFVTDGHFVGDARLPVYDSTLAVAFRLPVAIHLAAGAAFTPGGDSLFLSVVDSAGQGRLLLLDADDGTPLVDRLLEGPAGTPVLPDALARDPEAPLVFVAGTIERAALRQPVLLVLATDGTPVALLGAADAEAFGSSAPYDLVTVVPAPLYSAVFVVGTAADGGTPTAPVRVYRYDRPPAR